MLSVLLKKLSKRERRLKKNQDQEPEPGITSECSNFMIQKGKMHCNYYDTTILDTSKSCRDQCLGMERLEDGSSEERKVKVAKFRSKFRSRKQGMKERFLEAQTIEERGYSLKKSTSLVGQLYPVLKDADGNILDGDHRTEADGEWKTEILENINTPEKKLAARLIANMNRRTVPKTEKERWINDLAQLYLNQGLKIRLPRPDGKSGQGKNEISERIAKITGLSKKTVTGYMRDKFKQMNFSRGIYSRRNCVSPAGEVIAKILNSHSAGSNPGYGDRLLERYKDELLKSPIVRMDIMNSLPKTRKKSEFRIFDSTIVKTILDEDLPEGVYRGYDGLMYQRVTTKQPARRKTTKHPGKGNKKKKKDTILKVESSYYETFIEECPDCQCSKCVHSEECVERVRKDELSFITVYAGTGIPVPTQKVATV